MPYSAPHFNELSLHIIQQIPITRYLDIGAGAGKFGIMVKQSHPNSERVAVEICQDYVSRFNLMDIYATVDVYPAIELLERRLTDTWDLVTVGDTLEHLRKSEGIDLLNFLLYRSKYILVVYPDHSLADPWEGYRQEAHISAWTKFDFDGMEYTNVDKAEMQLVMIRGYLATLADPPLDVLVGFE